MRGILADINMAGHGDALLLIWTSDALRDLWAASDWSWRAFRLLASPTTRRRL